MMAKLHRIMDSMVGVHLNAHVMGKPRLCRLSPDIDFRISDL